MMLVISLIKNQLTSNFVQLNINGDQLFIIITTLCRYRHNFGHDYFSFWCGGVLFLVLNSQYYKSGSNVKELAAEQNEWLSEKLNTHKGQRIIIFQHIPWFIENINEDNGYFNIDKNLRQEMLEKMNAAGKKIIKHFFFFFIINSEH